MKESDVRILVVDDEEGMCRLLTSILEEEGYYTESDTSAVEALKRLETGVFDIAIVDIRMPEMNGLEFLEKARLKTPGLHFIMITAYGSIENAVDAVKIGAYYYITKPFRSDEIKVSVRKLLEHMNLLDENLRLKNELEAVHGLGNVKVASRKIMDLVSFARKIADSQLSVLITGESGTGKEVMARYIHDSSSRKDHPFVPVQCSLLPLSLLESELFGFKKGSFTGANENRTGLFEQANRGTIFLDEIGDISLDIQGKLLRFLQDREIRKIGDTKAMVLDVRLISATNKNLERLIKEREFREDLYFRLKVLTINMPPLRERREDIPVLVEHFIEKINETGGRRVEIDSSCLKYLVAYDWPGNIRELKNCIESAAAICDEELIKVSDILPIISQPELPVVSDEINMGFREAKSRMIEEFEKNYLVNMLAKHKGNIAASSRDAGMDRKNFWQLLRKYNIDPENYKQSQS